jgi:hypothetical protein
MIRPITLLCLTLGLAMLGSCSNDTHYSGFGELNSELRTAPTGDVLLDMGEGGALIGHPRPTIENADPALEMDLRLGTQTLPVASSAALTRDGQVITLSAAGEIRMGDRLLRPADAFEVAGPVALSADQKQLLYCQGHMPEFEVWALSLSTGAARQLTIDMAPAWSPAMTSDGALIFVSAKGGVPAIWIQRDALSRQLTNRDVVVKPDEIPTLSPTPAAISATRVDDRFIAFQGEHGVAVVDHEGQLLASIKGAATPFWRAPGQLGAVMNRGEQPSIETIWSAP